MNALTDQVDMNSSWNSPASGFRERNGRWLHCGSPALRGENKKIFGLSSTLNTSIGCRKVDNNLVDKLEAVIRYGLACQRSLKVPNGFLAALHRKCHSGAGL